MLELGLDGILHVVRDFLTQEGLYDCSWSEMNENQLVSASADGSLKLWDLLTSDDFPVAQWAEHKAEAASVDWNLVAKDSFVSASWDATIKLWDPHRPAALATFTGHQGCVYNAVWSPRHPTHFISCAGDGALRVWDARGGGGGGGGGCLQALRAHEGEVLSVDWDKYSESVVYSGGVDHAIKAWDLRRPQAPLSIMHGHGYAVRRLKSSPFRGGALGSVSYDMSCRTWNTKVRVGWLNERTVPVDWVGRIGDSVVVGDACKPGLILQHT